MKKWLVISVLGFLLSAGCNGAQRSQESLDSGMESNRDVRQALFVKAWGMNRALATESREKYVARAELELNKLSLAGTLTPETAANVMLQLSTELGLDEVNVSENFAYLTFLLAAGERADQQLYNVDIFLESKKPIWKHFSKQARSTVKDVGAEVEQWRPLIADIDSLIKSLKPTPAKPTA